MNKYYIYAMQILICIILAGPTKNTVQQNQQHIEIKFCSHKYKYNRRDLITKMTTVEQPPKQIKQYKDFTSVTAIRKFTQEAMAPVIRSLEQQLSSMMDDHKQLTKKVGKMEEIFKAQSFIQQRMEEASKVVRDYKDEQAQKRKEDQRKFTKIDNGIQKIFLQIHSVKSGVTSQEQTIKQINNRNIKMNQMYLNLNATNQKCLKEMQYKYCEFTKELLDMTKSIKQEHHKVQNQMDAIRESFKMQRDAIQEKSKNLDLYLSQRDGINQKFQDLYSRVIFSVTKDDFEAYRKSQKVFIDDQIKEIKLDLDQALPQTLREILPSVQKKLKQVEKIKPLQNRCKDLQSQIQTTVKKIAQVSDRFTQKIESLNKESQEKNANIQREFALRLQQLQSKQISMTEMMQERIQEMKLEIQEEVSVMIEKETSEIHKTIEAQVKSNKSVHKHNQVVSSARDQQLRKQIDEVKAIKQKIYARYSKIQELGQTIDKKIEGYSNKITRIKSDYELFAQNIRKEVSGVIKFRDTFLGRLEEVGRLLSSFAETLFIITSLLLYNNEQKSYNTKEPVVFVTENDGIIFEWRPQHQKGWITYRREKMEVKQFIRSFMYSLITFTDDNFSLQFLNWKEEKPSQFFRERVFSNYLTSRKRLAQAAINRRSPCFSSHPSGLNHNILMVEQVEKATAMDPSASTKQFSRTIDSKAKLDRNYDQANMALTAQDIPRNYSIKKSKPSSGRPNSKDKTSNQLSRYDQVFLTSRSACRSRISQLI